MYYGNAFYGRQVIGNNFLQRQTNMHDYSFTFQFKTHAKSNIIDNKVMTLTKSSGIVFSLANCRLYTLTLMALPLKHNLCLIIQYGYYRRFYLLYETHLLHFFPSKVHSTLYCNHIQVCSELNEYLLISEYKQGDIHQ